MPPSVQVSKMGEADKCWWSLRKPWSIQGLSITWTPWVDVWRVSLPASIHLEHWLNLSLAVLSAVLIISRKHKAPAMLQLWTDDFLSRVKPWCETEVLVSIWVQSRTLNCNTEFMVNCGLLCKCSQMIRIYLGWVAGDSDLYLCLCCSTGCCSRKLRSCERWTAMSLQLFSKLWLISTLFKFQVIFVFRKSEEGFRWNTNPYCWLISVLCTSAWNTKQLVPAKAKNLPEMQLQSIISLPFDLQILS